MAPEPIAIRRCQVGELQTNAYLVFSPPNRKCWIIDPGAEPQVIEKAIADESLDPVGIILTHGHMDHCGGARQLADHYHVPLFLHRDDEPALFSPLNLELGDSLDLPRPPWPERTLNEGERLEAAGFALTVIHLPGHSPGSIALYCPPYLFTGDTLFAGDVGRTDLPGGNEEQMAVSLARLKEFPPSTIILPGHGEQSTLERELLSNPYLSP